MSVKEKKDLLIPFRWDERRHIFLERFFYLPKQYDHAQKGELINWSGPLVFGNDRPVCLEFCSGNGQWIGDRALSFPESNWVAVEMKFERARKIWLKTFRENIPNLYVVCAEAMTFLTHYIATNCLSEAFINFPDPWPKLRHGKHRLVQAPFVKELSRAVKNEGTVALSTDCSAYRDQMIREFGRAGSWQALYDPPYYRTDGVSYGNSFFANLWKEKGREIFYLRYCNVSMD